MYQKMSSVCKKSLKKQFGFSTIELDQIEKFMSDNMGGTAREIIDTLMRDEYLDDRQKVMISYTIGASVGAESKIQSNEDIASVKFGPKVNVVVGQGG